MRVKPQWAVELFKIWHPGWHIGYSYILLGNCPKQQWQLFRKQITKGPVMLGYECNKNLTKARDSRKPFKNTNKKNVKAGKQIRRKVRYHTISEKITERQWRICDIQICKRRPDELC